MGALCVEPQSRKIVFKTSGEFGDGGYEPVTIKNETARLRLSSMIQLRDTLREPLNEEKGEGSESRMANLRQRLNTQYDAFVKKYGHLNSQTNRSLMREAPEHALLESLKADYDKGISPDVARKTGRQARPASARKAAVFRQPVLKPATLAQQAESPKDALVIVLRESGKVDFARMEQLLGRSTDVIQRDLQEQGLIFLNLATELWEIRDKYLTGNVRSKRRQARDAASSDPRFLPNVEALTEALLPDIEAVDIGINFGSARLPPSVISDFIELPPFLHSFFMLKARSTEEAFTAMSPTKMTAPAPFFSKRRPTSASFRCMSSHESASRMMSCPLSCAIRWADFSPVACSTSKAACRGFISLLLFLRASSPFSSTTYRAFSCVFHPCPCSISARILCVASISNPLCG